VVINFLFNCTRTENSLRLYFTRNQNKFKEVLLKNNYTEKYSQEKDEAFLFSIDNIVAIFLEKTESKGVLKFFTTYIEFNNERYQSKQIYARWSKASFSTGIISFMYDTSLVLFSNISDNYYSFIEPYFSKTGNKILGTSPTLQFPVREIFVMPNAKGLEPIKFLINNAEIQIFLAMYSLTVEDICDDVIRAFKKVKVKVIVDSEQKKEAPLCINKLKNSSVPYKMNCTDTSSLVNFKFCIVDSFLIIGSMNWSNSGKYNHDYYKITNDEEEIQEFVTIFNDLWHNIC